MSRFAGVELTSDQIRMSVFEGTSKKYKLVDYREESIASDDPEERIEQIRSVVHGLTSSKENRGLEVVSAIDSRRATLREMSVPFTKNEQIAKTIRFEAETALHAHSIEDVIIEFLKCEEHEDSSRLLVAAVRRDQIESHLADLKAVEIDPIHVELDATALATAFSVTPFHDPERSRLLVHVGDTSTRMVFIDRGHISRVRSFWSRNLRDVPAVAAEDEEASKNGNWTEPKERIEGARPVFESENLQDDLDRRFAEIEKSLEHHDQDEDDDDDTLFVLLDDDDEPAERRADGGLLPSTSSDGEGGVATAAVAAPARVSSPLDRLVVEIERTFAAQLLTESIDLVVVSGAVDGEMVTELGERLETDTVRFDFGDSFEVEATVEPGVLATHGVASIGLGLRALGLGLTDFDLRKEEFRFERRFAKLMPAFVAAAALLCCASLFWCLDGVFARKLHQRETLTLIQQQKQMTTAFFGEELKTSPNPNYPGSAEKKIKAFAGPGTGPRRGNQIKDFVRPTPVIVEIKNALSKLRNVYPKFEKFDLSLYKNKTQRSRITLWVPTYDDQENIRKTLEAELSTFNAVVSPDQQSDGGYKVTVELTFKPSVLE